MSRINALERLGFTGFKTVRFDNIIGGSPQYELMDHAYILCGLSKEATAWALYAYANINDDKSLSFLIPLIAKIIHRKHPTLPPRLIVGLVKIALRESMMGTVEDPNMKGYSVTLKSKVMGVSRKTYYQHKSVIQAATETILALIRGWEEQIGLNIKRKLK